MTFRRFTAVAAAIALVTVGCIAGSASAADAGTAEIHGRVTLNGKRVQTPVSLWSPDETLLASTRTDRSGAYSMRLPAAGTKYYVVANLDSPFMKPTRQLRGVLPSYTGARSSSVVAWERTVPGVASGSNRTLNIALRTGTTVTGKNPALAGRTVQLRTLGDTLAAASKADSNGRFAFKVAPGRYRLALGRSSRYLAYRGAPFLVVAGVTEKVSATPTAGGVVEGRLTYLGKAAVNVVVTLNRGSAVARTRTDTAGHYRFGPIPAGDYTVTAGYTSTWPSRYLYQKHVAAGVKLGGAVTVNMRLAMGGRVGARFAAATTHGYYTWRIRRGTDLSGRLMREGWALTSADPAKNAVSAFGLQPGQYLLQIHANGSSTYASRIVTVQGGRTVSLGVLNPSRDTVTLSGSAAPGSTMRLQAKGGQWGDSVTVPSTGRYVISHLVPGIYSAFIGDRSHAFRQYTVDLTTDQSLAASLGPAHAYGKVTGTVLLAGLPLKSGYLVLATGAHVSILNGRLLGTSSPGAMTIKAVHVDGSLYRPFPAGTPCYLTWPSNKLHFSYQPRATTDLGSIDLGVKGE